MAEQTWTPPPEGSICWVEIPGRNVDKLKTFYEGLFESWKFKPEVYVNDEDGHKVHMFSFERPDGLTGGIVEMPKDCPPQSQNLGSGFTTYHLVSNIDEATAKVEKLGGKVVLSKRPEGKSGIFANVVDPEGNRFGVYEYIGN